MLVPSWQVRGQVILCYLMLSEEIEAFHWSELSDDGPDWLIMTLDTQ